MGELASGVDSLRMAEVCQAGIYDAWIAAGRPEMQVELTLAVAEEDHGRAIQG